MKIQGTEKMESNKLIRVLKKKDNPLRLSSYAPQEERGVLSRKDVPIAPVSGRKYALPPWLFQHEELIHALETAKVIDKQSLTNTLNHIHFMDGHLLVQLRHPKYDDTVLVKVRPDPCLSAELTCHFTDEHLVGIKLKSYKFLHLVIDDGQSVILAPAVLNWMDKESFSVQLPQESYLVDQRQAKRHSSQGVELELVQGGLLIKGELLDFSPKGFRVRVSHIPSGTFDWSTGSDLLTMVHLRRGIQVLFAGLCCCIRHDESLSCTEVVLSPSDNQVKRSEKNEVRNPAQNISPTLLIIFEHPFFEKRIQLEVADISNSGFSVYEEVDKAVLMQGMIISDLTIEFAGAIKMECSAQVIGRFEKDERTVRCDFAILDMEINSYSQLSHILANALDPHAHISNKIDMDALWEFFFEAGFIYPEKYVILKSSRKRFKETYSRLYQDNPEISKHFTYQKNGRIYGHISMVRAYERAWMIHHHAARSVEGRRAGFLVLKQIMLYLNNVRRFPSAKMDYVMSYFRPENKFPDRVFGGFAKALGSPRGCSMDLFSYLLYTRLTVDTSLPEGWTLRESSQLELWELNRFYSNYSGGLLMDAMGFGQNNPQESLKEVYGHYGFSRKCVGYSLKHEEELNAILIVEQSDLGFNLSELLNGIKIVVTNPEGLGWSVLSIAIAQLARYFDMEKIPVLCYPFEYVEAKDVPYEKQYQAWVLDVRYGNEYVEYMRKKFKLIYK